MAAKKKNTGRRRNGKVITGYGSTVMNPGGNRAIAGYGSTTMNPGRKMIVINPKSRRSATIGLQNFTGLLTRAVTGELFVDGTGKRVKVATAKRAVKRASK